jgi:hypothetical protein
VILQDGEKTTGGSSPFIGAQISGRILSEKTDQERKREREKGRKGESEKGRK